MTTATVVAMASPPSAKDAAMSAAGVVSSTNGDGSSVNGSPTSQAATFSGIQRHARAMTSRSTVHCAVGIVRRSVSPPTAATAQVRGLAPSMATPESSSVDGSMPIDHAAAAASAVTKTQRAARENGPMTQPLLVVLAGRPGTGKTTLGSALAGRLGLAYLRVDVVENVVVNEGLARHPVGTVGYGVLRELARSNLRLGTGVLVDAVNPLPVARAWWRRLAEECGARLVVFETFLPSSAEHRARVEVREPDLPGQWVPGWGDVAAAEWVEWDEARDGARVRIDMTTATAGVADALRAVGDGDRATPA